jgi:hypothetical protein
MKIQDNTFPFLFSGKFGDIVGRVVNGKQVIFKKRGPRKSEYTLPEFTARRNFTIVSQFLKHMVSIFKKYDEPDGRSGFHKAMSHILRNAIQGQHPDQRIDFSKVILGKGILPNPSTYQVTSPAKGLLEFTWSFEIMKRKVSKSDRIFIAVYSEAMQESTCEPFGAERRERIYLMDVSRFSGQQIEVYFGFASPTGVLNSTSVYAGSIKVL